MAFMQNTASSDDVSFATYFLNIKEFKLFLLTKKPERKVARVFVRLEGVRLGEVDGIWRR